MRFEKSLAVLVALSMLLASIAGCATTGSTATTAPSLAASASSQTTATATPTVAPPTAPPANDMAKFDPPITITTAMAIRPADVLRPGDTADDNPLSRWMKDKLGIIITHKWTVADADNAFKTRIQLALSSGEELPDVFYTGYDDLFANLIDSGKIQSIDDSFDKYATDRVKYAYAQNPLAWNFVKKDGKKWGMPQLSDGFVGDTVMWLRQDWMDKLGLKAPTNLDEVTAVLDEFTNKDPDGNGQKDTYGLAIGGNSGYFCPLNDWMASAQFLFGQNQPYVWIKDADGKLSNGSISPVVKQGLGVLADWYKKGYLSPDFVSQDASKAAGDFTAGKCGMMFAPGWCGGWPIGDAVNAAKKDGKVFDAEPYPIPTGVNGDLGRLGSQMSYGAYVIRSGFDHMDAFYRVWDLFYGPNAEDVSSPFATGWAEGYDYIMKDGKPDWNPADLPGGASSDITRYSLLTTGGTPPHVVQGPNIYQRVQGGQTDTVYEQRLKALNGDLTIKAVSLAFTQMDKDVPQQLFASLPTKTMVSNGANLSTLVETTQFKIITGEKPLDYFDDFVKQWQDGGGTQMTQEVNDWYASVSK